MIAFKKERETGVASEAVRRSSCQRQRLSKKEERMWSYSERGRERGDAAYNGCSSDMRRGCSCARTTLVCACVCLCAGKLTRDNRMLLRPLTQMSVPATKRLPVNEVTRGTTGGCQRENTNLRPRISCFFLTLVSLCVLLPLRLLFPLLLPFRLFSPSDLPFAHLV